MIKKRLIQLLSHTKKYIAYNVLCQWIALLSQVVLVFTITDLINVAMKDSLTQTLIIQKLVIVAILILIRIVCEKLAVKASYYSSVDVKRILRDKIYSKMLSLGASYKDKIKTSEVVQVSTEGVEQLEIYFGRYLPQLFYSLLAPITLFAILSFVNFKASIVLLLCVPLIPISIVAVQKFAKKLLSKYWGLYTSLGDSFLENLQGLTTLKIYQADEAKTEQMDKEAQNFRKITMKVLTMQLNSISVMDVVAFGGAVIGMIVAVNEFLNGTITFAQTLAIILLASEFFIPLRLLGSFFHIAMNGMTASDKIFKLLDIQEDEQGTEEIEDTDIKISNLEFSYQEDRKILDNVNIEINKGSFVSLVGASGCGKSTIAGLLVSKNKNYQGNILIGNKELSSIKESSILENITLVQHNSYLFKGTVEDNLRMAKPNATQEDMENVLKQVNLWSYLSTQQGLQTKLLEKASNLSGGQCQRLALARALLHNSPIYIFDEATSNIDVESEEIIMNVVKEISKTKTVILISHRLANVVESDKIYVLKDGKIEENGTHTTLINQNGYYKQLFDSQQNLENYVKVV